MRKRLKRKRRSCSLCKPHKVGRTNRWKPEEFERMVRDEKEMRCVLGTDGKEYYCKAIYTS
jgi:hypothetical protein